MKDTKNEPKDQPKNGQGPKTKKKKDKSKRPESTKVDLSKSEMDDVTTVFRSLETGLRRASILPKVGCDNLYIAYCLYIFKFPRTWTLP